MFKTVNKDVWAFDAEWVPDPEAGRRLFQLAEETTDAEVIQKMWEEGGADEENPMPYLKTPFAGNLHCRGCSFSKETVKWLCP